MAIITMKIDSILGESRLDGHQDELDAIAISDAIEVPIPQSGGRARSVGQALHSDIQVIRVKDRASPKLALACSQGDNLGTVNIHLFRTAADGVAEFMRYELRDTLVSRIEHETEDDMGGVYQPHFVLGSAVAVAAHLGPMSLQSAQGTRGNVLATKPAVRPVFGGQQGAPTNTEVERMWLSSAQILWSYTTYTDGRAGGSVAKGWNIQQGVAL